MCCAARKVNLIRRVSKANGHATIEVKYNKNDVVTSGKALTIVAHVWVVASV